MINLTFTYLKHFISNFRMALVDRKISLPNDYDIAIAYIYPFIFDPVAQDISNEEVEIFLLL